MTGADASWAQARNGTLSTAASTPGSTSSNVPLLCRTRVAAEHAGQLAVRGGTGGHLDCALGVFGCQGRVCVVHRRADLQRPASAGPRRGAAEAGQVLLQVADGEP